MMGEKRKVEPSLGVARALSKLSDLESQMQRCRRFARSNAWKFVVEVF